MGVGTASGAAEASREHPVHVWDEVRRRVWGEGALLSPQLSCVLLGRWLGMGQDDLHARWPITVRGAPELSSMRPVRGSSCGLTSFSLHGGRACGNEFGPLWLAAFVATSPGHCSANALLRANTILDCSSSVWSSTTSTTLAALAPLYRLGLPQYPAR